MQLPLLHRTTQMALLKKLIRRKARELRRRKHRAHRRLEMMRRIRKELLRQMLRSIDLRQRDTEEERREQARRAVGSMLRMYKGWLRNWSRALSNQGRLIRQKEQLKRRLDRRLKLLRKRLRKHRRPKHLVDRCFQKLARAVRKWQQAPDYIQGQERIWEQEAEEVRKYLSDFRRRSLKQRKTRQRRVSLDGDLHNFTSFWKAEVLRNQKKHHKNKATSHKKETRTLIISSEEEPKSKPTSLNIDDLTGHRRRRKRSRSIRRQKVPVGPSLRELNQVLGDLLTYNPTEQKIRRAHKEARARRKLPKKSAKVDQYQELEKAIDNTKPQFINPFRKHKKNYKHQRKPANINLNMKAKILKSRVVSIKKDKKYSDGRSPPLQFHWPKTFRKHIPAKLKRKTKNAKKPINKFVDEAIKDLTALVKNTLKNPRHKSSKKTKDRSASSDLLKKTKGSSASSDLSKETEDFNASSDLSMKPKDFSASSDLSKKTKDFSAKSDHLKKTKDFSARSDLSKKSKNLSVSSDLLKKTNQFRDSSDPSKTTKDLSASSDLSKKTKDLRARLDLSKEQEDFSASPDLSKKTKDFSASPDLSKKTEDLRARLNLSKETEDFSASPDPSKKTKDRSASSDLSKKSKDLRARLDLSKEQEDFSASPDLSKKTKDFSASLDLPKKTKDLRARLDLSKETEDFSASPDLSKKTEDLRGSSDLPKKTKNLRASSDLPKKSKDLEASSDLPKKTKDSRASSDISKKTKNLRASLDLSKQTKDLRASLDLSKETEDFSTSLDLSRKTKNFSDSSDFLKKIKDFSASSDLSKKTKDLRASLDLSKETEDFSASSDLSKKTKNLRASLDLSKETEDFSASSDSSKKTKDVIASSDPSKKTKDFSATSDPSKKTKDFSANSELSVPGIRLHTLKVKLKHKMGKAHLSSVHSDTGTDLMLSRLRNRGKHRKFEKSPPELTLGRGSATSLSESLKKLIMDSRQRKSIGKLGVTLDIPYARRKPKSRRSMPAQSTHQFLSQRNKFLGPTLSEQWRPRTSRRFSDRISVSEPLVSRRWKSPQSSDRRRPRRSRASASGKGFDPFRERSDNGSRARSGIRSSNRTPDLVRDPFAVEDSNPDLFLGEQNRSKADDKMGSETGKQAMKTGNGDKMGRVGDQIRNQVGIGDKISNRIAERISNQVGDRISNRVGDKTGNKNGDQAVSQNLDKPGTITGDAARQHLKKFLDYEPLPDYDKFLEARTESRLTIDSDAFKSMADRKKHPDGDEDPNVQEDPGIKEMGTHKPGIYHLRDMVSDPKYKTVQHFLKDVIEKNQILENVADPRGLMQVVGKHFMWSTLSDLYTKLMEGGIVKQDAKRLLTAKYLEYLKTIQTDQNFSLDVRPRQRVGNDLETSKQKQSKTNQNFPRLSPFGMHGIRRRESKSQGALMVDSTVNRKHTEPELKSEYLKVHKSLFPTSGRLLSSISSTSLWDVAPNEEQALRDAEERYSIRNIKSMMNEHKVRFQAAERSQTMAELRQKKLDVEAKLEEMRSVSPFKQPPPEPPEKTSSKKKRKRRLRPIDQLYYAPRQTCRQRKIIQMYSEEDQEEALQEGEREFSEKCPICGVQVAQGSCPLSPKASSTTLSSGSIEACAKSEVLVNTISDRCTRCGYVHDEAHPCSRLAEDPRNSLLLRMIKAVQAIRSAQATHCPAFCSPR